MSINVKDVIKWLQTLSADDAIYIDEGGLSLVSENDGEAYLEVGGQSEMYDAIYIDEGGISLVSENDGEAYLEVGGQSEMCENDDEEDDDWEEDDVTHFGVFSDDEEDDE